ncbi:hypothetical protein Q1695_012333 [Nippostrongylus brasiliensis]|nr:hypothetical protein Q1695_012333 [Nippostrongylus brasiliensis]
MNQSEDGANGDEQDYTVHSSTFESEESLRCNRAGKFVSKGDQRATSSRKDVSHCSCYFNVCINEDGSVHARGCIWHVGHKVEPALLRITEEQKEFIKSLLVEHSLDHVIRRLRMDFSA